MRFSSVLLLSMGVMAQGMTTDYVRANARSMWNVFKQDYNKVYSPSEEARRFNIFYENMLMATAMGAEYGASPFADLTEEEFAVYHSAGAAFKKAPKQPLRSYADVKVTADPVDWRQKGAVTNVKNQGQCGSCWAFSTTGNVEGQWFLAGHTLASLSEEQLVACDKKTGDEGCNGGLPTNAYKYIESAGGLESESAYPYTSGTGRVEACKFDASKIVAKISGGSVLPGHEATMLTWLAANGPISIGVYAGGLKWQLYTGGIMKGCEVRQPDHGVLIVGYGTEGGVQYWIIKNSWGASWGENGYVRVTYGDNSCNIQSMPSSCSI